MLKEYKIIKIMKYIASFDIGLHNFSYTICSIDPLNIYYIDNIDLLEGINIKKFNINQQFYVFFHEFLKTLHNKISLCDICLIERQISKKNIKACNLYNQLVAHLAIFFPNMKVVPFPPHKKYSFFNEGCGYNKLNYRDRKNWSVDFISEIIDNQKDETAKEWFNSFSPKQDDVADCLIMTLVYSKENNLLLNLN